MATAKYVQKGATIDIKAPSALAYNEVVDLGGRIGVCQAETAADALAPIALTGVWTLPADKTIAINVGDDVYWNKSKKQIDKTDSGTYAGMAVSDKASSGETVNVRLG